MSRVVLRALPLLLVLWLSQGGTTEHRCNLGEYFYWPSKGNYSVCRPCEKQTFMNKTDHQETQCYPCSKVSVETAEYIVSECTRERNAIICPLDGYAHKVDDLTCQRIPGVCGPGGHLDPTSSNLCLMCSDDSYMHWKNHTNHDCYNCPVPDPNGHQTNREPCTKTQKSVIGCEDGYFNMNKNSSHGVQCHKCKNCTQTGDLKYVGKNCTQDSDTVCCPRPNMAVEKGQCVSSTSSTGSHEEQPSARGNNTRCKENQFLDFSDRNGQSSCKPCPKGTYRLESNHSNPMCNNCSDNSEHNRPLICDLDTNDSAGIATTVIAIVVPVGGVICLIVVVVLIYICFFRGKGPANQDSGNVSNNIELEERKSMIGNRFRAISSWWKS